VRLDLEHLWHWVREQCCHRKSNDRLHYCYCCCFSGQVVVVVPVVLLRRERYNARLQSNISLVQVHNLIKFKSMLRTVDLSFALLGKL